MYLNHSIIALAKGLVIIRSNRVQSDDLTWNTDSPDLTHCFQSSLLVWIQCVLVVAGACFYSPEVKPLVRDCRLTTQTLLQLVRRRIVTCVLLINAYAF